MSETPRLKYLQPSQYTSWLKKANDPEWDEERFGCSTRSKPERAAATFALELRDAFERNKALLDALEEAASSLRTIADKAGRDELLADIYDVRGYANSRATVARKAIDAQSKEVA